MEKDIKKTQSKSSKSEQKSNTKKEGQKRETKNYEKNKKVVIESPIESVPNKDSKIKVVKKEKTMTERLNVIDDNRKAILFGVVGFLVATLLFRCILWPERIATLKDGSQPVASIDGKTFTADELYESMKNKFSIENLLNDVDNTILVEKYPENDDMKKEVQSTADYYYQVYEQNYGYTKENFLKNYGFSSEKDFLESLTLDYRRNKYFDDYVEKSITDKEINDYYEKEVYGDIDSKHILVKISDDMKKEDAEKLAKEIISKLNDGKSWDDVVAEYKDKIVSEDLGYNAFNASLESAYLTECKNLEVGKYSKTPVLTSYGYHVVFKKAQKDKPKLNDVKDDIIDVLAKEKKNDDEKLYYKSLIEMRKDAELKFTDTKFESQYTDYVNSYK